jgi:hypothetical protein
MGFEGSLGKLLISKGQKKVKLSDIIEKGDIVFIDVSSVIVKGVKTAESAKQIFSDIPTRNTVPVLRLVNLIKAYKNLGANSVLVFDGSPYSCKSDTAVSRLNVRTTALSKMKDAKEAYEKYRMANPTYERDVVADNLYNFFMQCAKTAAPITEDVMFQIIQYATKEKVPVIQGIGEADGVLIKAGNDGLASFLHSEDSDFPW